MTIRMHLLVPAAALSALLLAGCAATAESEASSKTSHTHAAAKATDATKPDKPVKKEEISHKTLRIKKAIPFDRNTVKTSTLDKGVTRIDREGRSGLSVRVVRVTFKNGVELGRDLVESYVKREPTDQIKLVGTHVDPKPKSVSSDCDPNYAGACVPIASDVDCAGGSGDGPEYVAGPVRVVGEDIYDLNADDDNIACDS